MCQGVTSLLYLVSTDMYMLINYVSFVNWLAIGLSVVALLYFRYARPQMNRPIKVSHSHSVTYLFQINVKCAYLWHQLNVLCGIPRWRLARMAEVEIRLEIRYKLVFVDADEE